jgi:hypothetical protein
MSGGWSELPYNLLFLAALVVPVLMLAGIGHLLWKGRSFVALDVLLIYLITYVALTLQGEYLVGNRGGSDWAKEWAPDLLVESYRAPSGRARTRLTVCGAFFWPCLVVDRLVWHKTDHKPDIEG